MWFEYKKINLPDSETLQAEDEGDGEDALPPMGEHCSSSSDAELNRDEHEDTPELQELVVELSLTERRLLACWIMSGLLRPKFSKRRLRYRCSRCNCSLWLSTLRSRSSKFCKQKSKASSFAYCRSIKEPLWRVQSRVWTALSYFT